MYVCVCVCVCVFKCELDFMYSVSDWMFVLWSSTHSAGFRLSTAENLWELRKKMEKGEVNYQSMTCANGHLRW